jgi:hypothetical protein
VIKNRREREGHSPLWVAEPEKIIKNIYRVFTNEGCGFKSKQEIYFSLYTGKTNTINNLFLLGRINQNMLIK